ncbi:Alpha/beta hydrolase fold-1 [Hygrophoropsis aurantiaca]|uniref:Alpha/beta hydrolase fold-1 n=1 Tax=Hygrophoropsis aurantiaca TaxID=72124 RepID=A0ACB8AHT5_9AGAM|nr:Alpha/beta hydrolase fold-1 [Hygrophoropsis aurantiaca]
MSVPLHSRAYVFDPRPNFPFFLTANRYCIDIAEHDEDALTLVFAHATGFHKEHWEPTIEDLFRLFSQTQAQGHDGHRKVKIREMWSIDAPNHGDAAILNEKTLRWGYEQAFFWEDYGRGIHAFLTGLGTGIDVDFSKHNLVGIGHSMGAISIMLSTTYQPPLTYSSIHLIEPMIMGQQWSIFGNFLQKGAMNRRDIWPNIEEAYQIMKGRPSWKSWDERILRMYVNHGLRPLPTLEYPNSLDGVTLKCAKQQESATFGDYKSRVLAYNLLPHLAKCIPIHFVYGAIDDYTSAETKNDVLHNASGGIENLARVVRISGAGHLVLQTHPTAVAGVIWEGLKSGFHADRSSARSRTARL